MKCPHFIPSKRAHPDRDRNGFNRKPAPRRQRPSRAPSPLLGPCEMDALDLSGVHFIDREHREHAGRAIAPGDVLEVDDYPAQRGPGEYVAMKSRRAIEQLAIVRPDRLLARE